MVWKLEGECNECGECCRVLMGYRPMLNEKGVCMYLTEDNKCQIKIDPLSVPFAHFEYWKLECEPYPDTNSPAHTPPIHELVEGCGFRMVKLDG